MHTASILKTQGIVKRILGTRKKWRLGFDTLSLTRYTCRMEIQRIRRLCAEGKIKWSVHAAERMHERGIKRADVINCLETGEIIEEYPDDFPHPSCLVFGRTAVNAVLHVVAGISCETLFIITAYFPDTKRFESNLRTRRQRND